MIHHKSDLWRLQNVKKNDVVDYLSEMHSYLKDRSVRWPSHHPASDSLAWCKVRPTVSQRELFELTVTAHHEINCKY